MNSDLITEIKPSRNAPLLGFWYPACLSSELLPGNLKGTVLLGLPILVSQGIKAGDIANAIASTTGGKGGGRPHFASAGVGDLAKLGEARARTAEIVRGIAK